MCQVNGLGLILKVRKHGKMSFLRSALYALVSQKTKYTNIVLTFKLISEL